MDILDAILRLTKEAYQNGERISDEEAIFCASIAEINCGFATRVRWSGLCRTLFISVVPDTEALPERDGLERLFDILNKSSNLEYQGHFSPMFHPRNYNAVLPVYDAQLRPPIMPLEAKDLWSFLDDSVTRAGIAALVFWSGKDLQQGYPSSTTIDLLLETPTQYLQ